MNTGRAYATVQWSVLRASWPNDTFLFWSTHGQKYMHTSYQRNQEHPTLVLVQLVVGECVRMRLRQGPKALLAPADGPAMMFWKWHAVHMDHL